MCFIIFEFLLHNKVIESFKYPSTRVAPNGLLTSKFHYLALFREGRLHQKLGADALESVKIIHVDRVGTVTVTSNTGSLSQMPYVSISLFQIQFYFLLELNVSVVEGGVEWWRAAEY